MRSIVARVSACSSASAIARHSSARVYRDAKFKGVTSTRASPLNPRARAAATVKSITRPRTYGPRSFMRTTTLRPLCLLVTRAYEPNGRERCAAVSEPGDKRSPLAVFPPEPPYTDAVPVCELATDEKVAIATMQQNVTTRRVIIFASPHEYRRE